MSTSRICPFCSVLHDVTHRCGEKALQLAWQRVSRLDAERVDATERYWVAVHQARRPGKR